MSKKMNSRYWLDDDFIDQVSESSSEAKDPVKLAAYRKAVGNFVRIVTGEPIPVNFSTGDDSYTDGKSVTIAAKMKQSEFDSSVGLALHEGSHIKLTDFSVLKTMDSFIQSHDDVVIELAQKHGFVESYDATIVDRWRVTSYVQPLLKDLHNIIEDRRIDNYIYRTAPGYRGYYEALYAKYFNAKIIDKGLQSSEYRTEDWDSYMFRVINITNVHRDLDALKGLRRVWEIMDLANVDRLQSTQDTLQIAWEMFLAIEEHIPSMTHAGNSASSDSDDEYDDAQSAGNTGGSGKSAETPEGEAPEDDGKSAQGSEIENGTGSGNAQGQDADDDTEVTQVDDLSDRQRNQLEKAIEKQKQFNDGSIKKPKANKSLQQQISAIETADVETREVTVIKADDGNTVRHPVLVIRNFNIDLINAISSDMYFRGEWELAGGWGRGRIHIEAVKEGIRLGTMLGKKLKVRVEERNTKFNRLRSGKIDKRMIANAGFGAEGIFEKIETFAYRPGMIHLSIDNSGSMGGEKFIKSLKTAAAIAKACDMIDNMECVISFRAGAVFGSGSAQPVILIAYDSRRHNMIHLRKMLPYVKTAGSTPEGLCFDAIMKEVIADAKGKDAYFVNFSDGEPWFGYYCGETAYRHTRAQVNKMTQAGIKVISYFITPSAKSMTNSREKKAFTSMYGKDALFIDVDQINEVARTMNGKFLEVA